MLMVIHFLIKAYRTYLFLQVIEKDLFLHWGSRFQTPSVGYSETAQERMCKQAYICFHSFNTCKQSNIESVAQ